MNSVKAELIYTGKGIKKDSVIRFQREKVRSITAGKDKSADKKYAVITPAFIDAHSHIGMNRSGEPGTESESNEKMESMMTAADALDSVQMDDRSFQDAIEAGVLYSCVVPGSGNIIGGRAAVIRNYGANTSEALIGRAGIKAAFGYNPMSTRSWKGSRPYTRMGALSLLRSRLTDIRNKEKQYKNASSAKKKEMSFSAEEELLRKLIAGREILRVHVHKADDIMSLLRITDEFGLKITVEHSCDVNSTTVYRELKKRKIPVVYGPVDSFAYKVELRNAHWRNIRNLLESGVEFGLMTDHPVVLQNMLLLQLRWFLRCGMNREQAIGVITAGNSRILGLDKYLGTLEKNKWASFVCWDGDPFSLDTRPVAVFAEGKPVYTEKNSC